MLIYLLAFVGGVLTILSPCILPVLPFVFSRADQPFRRSGLPLLTGMALTFALVATAAAFGGHWVVRLNQGGRYVAIAIFLVLGLTLIFPSLAEALTRPLVQAGAKIQGGDSSKGSIGKSFVLGISTGLLWAPCAGPILGLILTGAAIQGPGARSCFLRYETHIVFRGMDSPRASRGRHSRRRRVWNGLGHEPAHEIFVCQHRP